MASEDKFRTENISLDDRQVLDAISGLKFEPLKTPLSKRRTSIQASSAEINAPARRVENIIAKYENIIQMANELQVLVDERSKKVFVPYRGVSVGNVNGGDRENLPVSNAVRRVFGKDTPIITYDMYKEAIACQAQMAQDQNVAQIGLDAIINGNTGSILTKPSADHSGDSLIEALVTAFTAFPIAIFTTWATENTYNLLVPLITKDFRALKDEKMAHEQLQVTGAVGAYKITDPGSDKVTTGAEALSAKSKAAQLIGSAAISAAAALAGGLIGGAAQQAIQNSASNSSQPLPPKSGQSESAKPRDKNPMHHSDCNTIAQTYERGVHRLTEESAVYPTFTKDLTRIKMFSSSTIGALRHYQIPPGTDLTNKTSLDFNGSQVNITEPNSLGDKIKQGFEDCIPCSDRIKALLDLNPLEDFLNVLEADINNKLASLLNILDLFNNTDIFNDICALVNLLSFQCVPDLVAILAALKALLCKFAVTLDDIDGFITTLLSMFLAPMFSGLMSLIDQYVQLIMDPIDCIISNSLLQMSKLNVNGLLDNEIRSLENLQFITREIVTGKAQIAKDMVRKVTTEINEVQSTFQNEVEQGVRTSLGYLNEYLIKARSLARAKLNDLNSELGAFLTTESNDLDNKVTNAEHFLRVTRLIGFVTALIQANSLGELCRKAGTPDLSLDELEMFIKNRISPITPIQIDILPDQTIVIRPTAIGADIPNLLNLRSQSDNLASFNPVPVENLNANIVEEMKTVLPLGKCLFTGGPDDVKTTQDIISRLETL